MRPLLENAELIRPMFSTGVKSRVMKSTIADNYQITKDHPFFMWLDPNGGNKDVRLPLATDVEHAGLFFIIINDADAAESLVVKNAGETETVVTIGQGNVALVFNDGASVTGWIGVVLDQTTSETVTNLTATGNVSVGGTLDVTGVTTLANAVATNLDLGASGTAGSLDIFPTTASKGKLAITVTDQTGDTTVSLAIGAMAAARTITLRDPGAAASLLTTTDATAAATTATAVEITMAADNSVNTEIVTATNVITAAESGATFFLNSATEFASTLPAPAAGLRYSFIVTAAPSGADYTITTNSSANIIIGQTYTVDVNSATDPDFEATGCDTISFVSAKSIVGDRVDVICDGTNWFAQAFCSVFDAITFTTAS